MVPSIKVTSFFSSFNTIQSPTATEDRIGSAWVFEMLRDQGGGKGCLGGPLTVYSL